MLGNVSEQLCILQSVSSSVTLSASASPLPVAHSLGLVYFYKVMSYGHERLGRGEMHIKHGMPLVCHTGDSH